MGSQFAAHVQEAVAFVAAKTKAAVQTQLLHYVRSSGGHYRQCCSCVSPRTCQLSDALLSLRSDITCLFHEPLCSDPIRVLCHIVARRAFAAFEAFPGSRIRGAALVSAGRASTTPPARSSKCRSRGAPAHPLLLCSIFVPSNTLSSLHSDGSCLFHLPLPSEHSLHHRVCI